MDQKKAKAYRDKLVLKKQEILEAYNRNKSYGKEADGEATQDIADKAANSYTKEFLFSLSNTERDVLQQVDEALGASADYVAVGPVFGTATKDTGYSARGLDLVRHAARRGKPIVAIGGITLARAPDVIDAGAGAVAVITDILIGGDPESRVRDYVRALQ